MGSKIFAAVSIAFAAATMSQPTLAESRALLIGVGQYQNPESNLPGIELDINIMRKVAGQLGYKDSQISVLMDQQVTRANVEQAFAKIAQSVTAQDKVLIYYSGHGTQVPDQSGGDESDNYDEALTLYNLGSGDDYGVLIDDDLNRLLRTIPTQHKTLMVDACCSGSAVKSLSIDKSAYPDDTRFVTKSSNCPAAGSSKGFGVAEASSLDGIIYISAAQDDQSSLATSQGSVFTLAVQNAFRAGIDLSPRELLSRTDAYITHRIPVDRRFNPNLLGDNQLFDNKSLFVVAPSSAPAASSPERPSHLREWMQLTRNAGGAVTLAADKNAYREGENLQVTIDMPFDGYLNLVAIDPQDRVTLLYPNQWAQQNRVSKGRIGLPFNGYIWPAQPPHGKNHLVAISTQNPVNLFESAHERNPKGEATQPYLVPSEAAVQALLSNAKSGSGNSYHAGIIPVETCQSGC